MATGTTRVAGRASAFSAAWEEMYHIFGWLSECEAKALFNAAMQVSEDGLIIEVGAFRGRSTALLGETGRRVLTVDPLDESTTVAKLRVNASVVAALTAVVDAYPNVEWTRRRAGDTPCPAAATLLYIDGNHIYPAPRKDFEHFRPALSAGGLVVFHDYGRDIGVTRTVDELETGRSITRLSLTETMYVGEVP